MNRLGPVLADLAPASNTTAPGVAASILEGGEESERLIFGHADISSGQPIDAHTRFHIVSAGKPIVAAALLILQADGRLSLDDDVRDHLPEFALPHPVQLRHLLSMTSGLQDSLEILRLAGQWHARPGTEQACLALGMKAQQSPTPPGQCYRYNNFNIVLLNEVIRRASGMARGRFYQERLFGPAGLVDTMIRADEETATANLATGYVADGDGWVPGAHLLGIAGDVFVSSLADMVAWLKLLRMGRLGTVALTDPMRRRAKLAAGGTAYYGLGLAVRRWHGHTVVCHSGSQPGYKTHIAYCPDKDIGFVMLSNIEHAAPAPRFARLLQDAVGATKSSVTALAAMPPPGLYLGDRDREPLWLTGDNKTGLRVESLGDSVTLAPTGDGTGWRAAEDYGATQPVDLIPTAGGDGFDADFAGHRDHYRPATACTLTPKECLQIIGGYRIPATAATLRIVAAADGGLAALYDGLTDSDNVFPLDVLAHDVLLVRPRAPGIDFKHLICVQRDDTGAVMGLRVRMERLKDYFLPRQS
jgi:CubicO group peptidase (beta-lactamase class C family)